MKPPTHADTDMLMDDLTCWILDLNLPGVTYEPRVQDAARSAVVDALRSGASAADAVSAGKTVVSSHVEQLCS